MKVITALLITYFILNINLSAQENEKTGQSFGFTAALQSSQMDIMVPVFLYDQLVFAPSVGYSHSEDKSSDLAVGFAVRYYLKRGTVSPFIGARYGLLIASPKQGDKITDTITGLGCGGEYFISKEFSLGIEAQLNFAISDKNSLRFGNPGNTNVNTATAIFASIYF